MLISDIAGEVYSKLRRPVASESVREWAERTIYLGSSHGVPGPINLDGSRHLLEPLIAVTDHTTTHAAIIKPVQSGGTVTGEVGVSYYLANRPGSIHWVTEKDDSAKKQMMRLRDIWMANPDIKPLLPHDLRKLTDGGGPIGSSVFQISGKALSNLQSSTRHLVVVDELAFYENENVIKEVESRMAYTMAMGSAKLVIISQAGMRGGELIKAYRAGTMEEWMLPCENCKTYIKAEPKLFSASGRKFNDPELGLKDKNNQYILGKLEAAITFDCPHCGHHMQDSSTLKRYWNENGKYIAQNDNPLSGHRSFHWPPVISRKWSDLVYEWITTSRMRSDGDASAFIKHLQKDWAITYDPEEYFDNERVVKTAKMYDVAASPYEQSVVIMTIDVQGSKLYTVIREWSLGDVADSRLLYANWQNNIQEIISLQETYGVSSRHGRRLVFWDSGFAGRQAEVYGYCVQHKHFAIKGDLSGTKQFDNYVELPNGKKVNIPRVWALSEKRADPNDGMVRGGPTAPLYILATDRLKSILIQLREGRGPRWDVLDRSVHPSWEDYNKAMYNERLCTVDRSGKPLRTPVWRKVIAHMTNEAFDCEAYQIGAAKMCGVKIDLYSPSTQIKVNDTETT